VRCSWALSALLTVYVRLRLRPIQSVRRYINKTRLLRVYEEPSNVIHLQMQKKYGFK
jgi:hypothetical protein